MCSCAPPHGSRWVCTDDNSGASDDGCQIVEEEGDQAREVAPGWLEVLNERDAAGVLEVGRLLPVAHVGAHFTGRLIPRSMQPPMKCDELVCETAKLSMFNESGTLSSRIRRTTCARACARRVTGKEASGSPRAWHGGNYSFGYEYTFRAGGGFRERELLLSYEPVRYTLLPGARESRGSPRFAQAFLGAPMQRSRTSRPILRRRSPLLTIAHNGRAHHCLRPAFPVQDAVHGPRCAHHD